MLRWYPMARATSRLGGRPIIYDLTKVRHLSVTVPSYQRLVRDLETVRRSVRRKRFGSRPAAEIAFLLPHDAALNTMARWYEIDGANLIKSPLNPSLAPWVSSNLTVTASPSKDPLGTFAAFRLTDGTVSAIGNLSQNTGQAAAAFTGLLSAFVRSDSPHVFAVGIGDNVIYETDVDRDATSNWRRIDVRASFPNDAANFQVLVRATQLAIGQTGSIDLYLAELKRIAELSGTDEEILSDLSDKLSSDDWDVDLALDGGLNWRRVILDDFEKSPMEDKWVGHRVRFSLSCTEPIQRVPAALDGTW